MIVKDNLGIGILLLSSYQNKLHYPFFRFKILTLEMLLFRPAVPGQHADCGVALLHPPHLLPCGEPPCTSATGCDWSPQHWVACVRR